MWKEQSPRQVLELLKSYKDMNTDEKTPAENKKSYTLKSKKAKLPDWFKKDIPKGTVIYHADDIDKGDL